MSSLMVYCRFCAEEKPSDATINFATAEEKRSEVIQKLSLFSNKFVDFDNKTLPEHICETCFTSLEFTHKFFVKVKESQDVLEQVFSKATIEIKLEEESDDPDCGTHFEEAPPPSWSTYPWRCSHCELTMDSLTSLRAHTKEHHNTCYGYSCADCDEKVDELQEFVDHVLTHREELRNYCEHCNIKTADPSHRETHIADHCCTFCGEIFPEESTLLAHLKQYVTKSTGLLAFDVSIYESYDSSEVKSWSDYPSICKFCKIRVFNKDFLISHCMGVHGACFGMQCMDCDENTDTFTEFIHHVYTHRPELICYCPYCDIRMGEKYDDAHIESHTRNQHQCRRCGDVFPHKRKLQRHMQAMRGSTRLAPIQKKPKTQPTEEDLTCDTCGAVMKSETTLKVHKNLHKVREKNYTCEHCGLAYYTSGALNSHRKTHETIKGETCKICKKTFLNITRLRKHVQTHNFEKPFECDDCKKCFSSKQRLKSHIYTHMDIFNYSCRFCAKKFKHRSLMKVHENQHTGARPYSCKYCDMVFANWSNCNKHMKRKHDRTLAKSVMTPQGKIEINPKTGKPYQLEIDSVVKEWKDKLFSTKRKQRNSKVISKQNTS